MKKTIKLIAIIMIIVMGLAGCDKAETGKKLYNDGETDSQYVKNKGKLVVGITDFKPMDYKNDDEWIGFDAEMAKEFADNLGVEVEYVEIDWDNKEGLLENGDIDCVWNGMTLTDKVKESMACTGPYLKNSQVVVVKSETASNIKDIKDCTHFLFAVESGSAGEQVLKDNNIRYLVADTQNDALKNVADRTADAAVADSILVYAMIGNRNEYADLACALDISDEEYGVGFRKNSDIAGMLDEFFDSSYEDGTMTYIAEKYGVDKSLIERE